jgi:hypothetical protein
VALVCTLGVLVAGCAGPLRYELVDTLEPPAIARATDERAVRVAQAVDVTTLQPDVDYLACPALGGRERGLPGNALARAHIIARLQRAGLAPLFGETFEQPAFAGDGAVHAVNVGAIYRSPERDAEWVILVAHYDHLGVIRGHVHPGADDNASSVALLLAVGDALGRTRPALRRHVVLLFPDAEEPPYIRTERMGSAWFWRHLPLPADTLHLALVLDLVGGRSAPELQAAGLGHALFVLGAEADPSLRALVAAQAPITGVEPVTLSLATVEAMPYRPGTRFPRSDYHGLREDVRRPFLFLTTGRTETYHTPEDTPDRLDYERLGRVTRWIAQLAVHAAQTNEALGWRDWRADARADARLVLRLSEAVERNERLAPLLRRALAADRRRIAQLLASWEQGAAPTPEEYRELLLASIRVQAAFWHPSGWWFALW